MQDVSFIETLDLDFELPQNFNWLFFTSPKGVSHFLSWTNIETINSKKIGCIGKGTAQTLENFGIKPNFIGINEVAEVAQNFKDKLNTEDVVLFPGALESKLSVQRVLPQNQVINLPVYETNYKNVKLGFTPDIVAFTSPSNVRAFFAGANQVAKNTLIFSIGNSTAEEVTKFGYESTYPKVPNEEMLLNLILSSL